MLNRTVIVDDIFKDVIWYDSYKKKFFKKKLKA